MVFQSYALYPHMTRAQEHRLPAEDGRRRPRRRSTRRSTTRRAMLNLTNYLDRRPRPALRRPAPARRHRPRHRARSPRPSCSTSRCPTSTPRCAATMRLEITELHHQLKTTMIYVTHDQVEAMTMADKIVVLNAGNIEQVGSPLELYKTPDEPVRRRLHRLAEDEPDRGRAGRQAQAPRRSASAPSTSTSRRRDGDWKAHGRRRRASRLRHLPARPVRRRPADRARRRRDQRRATATRST